MFAHVCGRCRPNVLAWTSNWKYLDLGTEPGTGWAAKGFDDSTWKVGRGELGTLTTTLEWWAVGSCGFARGGVPNAHSSSLFTCLCVPVG